VVSESVGLGLVVLDSAYSDWMVLPNYWLVGYSLRPLVVEVVGLLRWIPVLLPMVLQVVDFVAVLDV
jgi:hypothetical protein